MDSDESYHSESEFYYPNEITNDNEKESMGAISNGENQQNVDVFMMANVQNYILAQPAENTVKKRKEERKRERKKKKKKKERKKS